MNHLVDQYFDSLIDKKIAVLGIGVSNRPLIRMLLARGLHVLACDKTPREKLDAEVLELERAGTVLHVGEHYLDDVQADIVFRTPGMHPDIPALRRLRAGRALRKAADVAGPGGLPCGAQSAGCRRAALQPDLQLAQSV